ANGYRADLLPTICEIYLAARSENALPYQQAHVAAQAEMLVRALAHVGIIALVDEATGYQEVRTKDALSRILEAFVAKELQPWVRTFPPEFYREMFRLRGIDYNPNSVHRPQYFGKLTNDIIYDRLAPGVRDELKAAQKKAEKSGKLFQHLTTSVGYPKLREHLGSVVTLMKLSSDWGDFKAKLDTMHPS
ncbi:P63C domain-containing protein, partial [Pasteurella multocida]|uniref:P63C domain-containing protein n=1 Tax=Pasteurella multocida TaxID=747 RepID=UPI002ECDC093|nr:P63C domain-containing protein [Pasteurella multocida]